MKTHAYRSTELLIEYEQVQMPFPNQELLSSSQRSYGVTKTLCNLRLVLGGKPGGQLVI